MPHDTDVTIIGGGPAGLQAALTLGRVHRRVTLLDSGTYRNDPAAHLHNFITHDGAPPAQFRARAHADLAEYDTVEARATTAVEVSGQAGDFTVTTSEGGELRSRVVLLATGVKDVLPDVPGLAENWGSLVHHCPFCHGHELAGQTIGLQDGPKAPMLTGILAGISTDVHVLPGLREVARDGNRLHTVSDLGEMTVDGFFAATDLVQAAPFADQLGLTLLDSGCIEIDAMGRTSRDGVLAAGDLAHAASMPMPNASVLAAAAAGQMAGSAAHGALL